MKMILFAFLFSGSAVLAINAQDVPAKDVPQAVSSALTQQYATAKDLEWEKSGDNYEAEFDIEGTEHTVLISPSGEILMTKSDVLLDGLPQPVKSALDQKYKDMPLDDMELIERDGKTYYQVELDDTDTNRLLVFSADGQEVTEPAYWD